MTIHSPTAHALRLMAVLALMLGLLGLQQPAQAATVTVTGTVSSDNGITSGGMLRFFADCQSDQPVATTGWFGGAPYSVSIPTGTYKVQIWVLGAGVVNSWHSAKRTCAEADPVTISGSGAQDLKVIAVHAVTGSVSSSRGAVSDGAVEFYEDCAAWDVGDWSDRSGFGPSSPYTVSVPAGSYKVRILPDGGTSAVQAWHSAKDSCAAADTIAVSGARTANLVAAPGWNVSGSVSSSNGAVSSGTVSFYKDCDAWDAQEPTASVYFDGQPYTVSVPSGTYKVLIEPDDATGALLSWHSAKTSCADATTVPVSADATVALTAVAGANVTGSVRSSNGPVSGGYVDFYTDCGPWHPGQTTGVRWDGGQYLITLVPGSYRVAVRPDRHAGALESWHNAKQACADAEVIVVSGNRTLDLTAVAGANVTGVVKAQNTTVTEADLEFYATCADWEDEDLAAFVSYTSGTAYLATVKPGTYKVKIDAEGSGVAPGSWHRARTSCASADTITVAVGSNTVDLEAVSTASPPPPPPPPPPPQPPSTPPAATAPPVTTTVPLAAQSATFSLKSLKRKKSASLPAATAQGAPLTWVSQSKKTCSVKSGKVRGLRKGKCSLTATAPAVAGFSGYSAGFVLRVK